MVFLSGTGIQTAAPSRQKQAMIYVTAIYSIFTDITDLYEGLEFHTDRPGED
mgnify:CR=1 FL=1